VLGNRFAGNRNSLNAVRLFLAAAVILSHSWWLGGYGPASLGFSPSLVHLPLTVLLLTCSLHLPLSGVGSRFDISYGVYIYGWPVQQFLASLGLHSAVPPLVFGAASLLLVAPVAWLSCRYVEGPAQRWHRSRDIQRKVRELA
jgi:peptidoglycan/LPS O-acetylase OafA/YrhL